MTLKSLAIWLCIPALAFAVEEKGEKAVHLKPGDKAPAFQGKTDEGKTWKSADHVGKKILVVYFYPADFTGEKGGCTAQACGYRDALKDLKRDDVEVVGVSGDSVENHEKFKKEHDLNFTLLADEDGKIAKAFGVKMGPGGVFEWTSPKTGNKLSLKRGVTESRWTFVIDKDGRIAYKDEKVKAPEDAGKVLKAIAKLEKR
jgi:peroxiredoxin Q/BCP